MLDLDLHLHQSHYTKELAGIINCHNYCIPTFFSLLIFKLLMRVEEIFALKYPDITWLLLCYDEILPLGNIIISFD